MSERIASYKMCHGRSGKYSGKDRYRCIMFKDQRNDGTMTAKKRMSDREGRVMEEQSSECSVGTDQTGGV